MPTWRDSSGRIIWETSGNKWQEERPCWRLWWWYLKTWYVPDALGHVRLWASGELVPRTQHSWFLMVLGVKLSFMHTYSDVQSISDTFGEAGEKNVTSSVALSKVKFKKKQCQ